MLIGYQEICKVKLCTEKVVLNKAAKLQNYATCLNEMNDGHLYPNFQRRNQTFFIRIIWKPTFISGLYLIPS